MKLLYAILDTKSKSFGPLMGIPNDTVAVREFGAAIEMKDSPFMRYSEDFELVCVGQYHDDDGDLEVHPIIPLPYRVVITATAWIASRKPSLGGV